MLQMIPQMSKEKALTLIQQEDCSCPKKLFNYLHNNQDAAFAQLPVAKKVLVFQSHFGKSKSGAPKNQPKLSKHVYNMMTSFDPEAIIADV